MIGRVVRAVAALLAKSATIAPVDVFVEMNLLQASHLESWRFGRIPYLEKAIRCNLAVASRILRILRTGFFLSALQLYSANRYLDI